MSFKSEPNCKGNKASTHAIESVTTLRGKKQRGVTEAIYIINMYIYMLILCVHSQRLERPRTYLHVSEKKSSISGNAPLPVLFHRYPPNPLQECKVQCQHIFPTKSFESFLTWIKKLKKDLVNYIMSGQKLR